MHVWPNLVKWYNWFYHNINEFFVLFQLADLTMSKRPETSYQIETYFAVVNHSYLLCSYVKLVET